MLKFKNSSCHLFVSKDGDKLWAELKYNGKTINRENSGFLISLAEYENKNLECTINGKELFYKGELIKTYDNVFSDGLILDLRVHDGIGQIYIDDCVLDDFVCDLNRKNYKVNVKNDQEYVVVRYANLHQHTENSLLDGIVKIPELAKKAEYASAITDHGNMFGWYDMLTNFNKLGKKAIIGEEFYVSTLGGPRLTIPKDMKSVDVEELMFDNSKTQNSEGLNGEHLIVLAKNNTGIKNLFWLSTQSSIHFYRKGHITLDELISHKDGLIVCSACIASGMNQFIKEYLKAKEFPTVKENIENYGEFFYEEDFFDNKEEDEVAVYAYNHRKSREWIDTLYNAFGEDFYLEYQDHNFPLEELIMNEMVRIRDEEYPNIKIVATTDAHYLNKEDAYVHELFLCNQTKRTIDDPKHMKFSGNGYYVHTSEEMLEKFPVEYLDATLEIEEKVHYEPFEKGYHLPNFPLPKGFKTDLDYFKYVCSKNFKEKFGALEKTDKERYIKYLEQYKHEGRTIQQMGWPAYFLIVSDFIRWAEDTDVESHWQDYFPDKEYDEIPKELLKKHKIYIGSGRGSAAGSLICYILGITKVDPLEYDLSFERFLNPERISMPDIDTDIEDVLRGEVFDYVRFKYGKKKVANIITFGTAAAKNSIKTINRVLGYPVANGERITSLIPDKPGIKIIDAFEDKEFETLYNSDKNVKTIVDLAQRIEGLKTSLSIHPCAVLICDKSITNYMPEVLMTDPETNEKIWVTQMEGPTCEELGCLKMDFLGLRTLGYVHETIDNIKKNHNVEVDYNKIDLTDINDYKSLAEGNTASIFQCESDMFTTVIKKTLQDIKIKPDASKGKECFERLVAMNALVRPGSNQFIDDFADRIMHPEHITYLVPELEPILKGTYGIILYQEQTMRITRDLAGFSAGQADTVRKAMGKKKKYIMDEYKDYFVHGNKKMNIKGCVANGIPEDKASELWDIMALASSYSFNKSHAVAYSMHSIRTAWLNDNYPFEYLTAVLNSFANDTDKITKYLTVAKEKGLKVLPPSVNESFEKFTTNGKTIQIGLSGIKGINAVAEEIIQERVNGNFTSLEDLLNRMSYYKNFSKRTLESLIYAGMLDQFDGTRKDKINQITKMSEYVKKLKDYRKKLNDGKKHRNLSGPTLVLETSNEEIEPFELLMKEKKYTGMYISGNPMDLFSEYTGNSKDCSSVKQGNCVVCGIVKEVERKISKKGNIFYTFKLENNGSISGIMYASKGETISDDEVVKLEGKVTINEFGANIKVDSKESLTETKEICENKKDIYITIPNREAAENFKKLKFPEGTRTIHAFAGDRERLVENVDISPQMAMDIIEIAGIENISQK